MNQNTFNKISGKKFTQTLNNNYQFSAPVVGVLSETEAWYEPYAAVVTERDGYRFHIFYAANGTYFKYDGPGSEIRCINLVVEDIKAGEAWQAGALIYRGAKQAKTTIRRYRDIALKSTISEIEETRQREKSSYTWRYFVNTNGAATSLTEIANH